MKILLEKKVEELESGQWKIGFQNNQFVVKDFIEPVVGVVSWAREYIGKAAQASPYSSVAWAGVCLLLPVRSFNLLVHLFGSTVHPIFKKIVIILTQIARVKSWRARSRAGKVP